jgi:hypothetical protein
MTKRHLLIFCTVVLCTNIVICKVSLDNIRHARIKEKILKKRKVILAKIIRYRVVASSPSESNINLILAANKKPSLLRLGKYGSHKTEKFCGCRSLDKNTNHPVKS